MATELNDVRLAWQPPGDLRPSFAYAGILLKANPRRISRFDSRLREERDRAKDRFQEDQRVFGERLQDHLGDYTNGRITRGQAERRLKREIREHYRTAFELGKRMAGNLYLIEPSEEKWLRKLRYDEFKYLRGFLDDIDNGEGKMPYPARMDMYEKAIREVGWMGWLIGNRDRHRRIVWHYSPLKEHCRDCEEYDGKVWTIEGFIKHVQKTGHLPQSGSLECLGYHCGCYLEELFV